MQNLTSVFLKRQFISPKNTLKLEWLMPVITLALGLATMMSAWYFMENLHVGMKERLTGEQGHISIYDINFVPPDDSYGKIHSYGEAKGLLMPYQIPVIIKESKVSKILATPTITETTGLNKIVNFVAAQPHFTPFGAVTNKLPIRITGNFPVRSFMTSVPGIEVPEGFLNEFSGAKRRTDFWFLSENQKDSFVHILEENKIPYLDRIKENGALLNLLKMERNVVVLLGALVTLTGGFAVWAISALSVKSKKRDISVFMLFGADRLTVFKLYFFQGLMFGIVGGFIGYLLGWYMSSNMYQLLVFASWTTDIEVPMIYADISRRPIQSGMHSIWIIFTLTSIFMTTIMTVWPGIKASKTEPGLVLREETT